MAPMAGLGHPPTFLAKSALPSIVLQKSFCSRGATSPSWARRSDNNVRGYFIL
jgi:hypothetical protein